MPLTRFVSKLIHEGKEAILESKARGIEPSLLEPHNIVAARVLSLLYSHVEQESESLSPYMVSCEVEDFEATPPEELESLTFYFKIIQDFRLVLLMSPHVDKIQQELDQGQGFSARNAFFDLYAKLAEGEDVALEVRTLFSHLAEVQEHYARLKAGEQGVPFAWPSLTALTGGMWPQDLVLLVARTGMGKTWALILQALEAWEAGYRVLFVTTEISVLTLALRAIAIKAKLPYNDFRTGNLDEFHEERFKETAEYLSAHDDRLFVIGGNFNFRFESVALAIEMCKPDLLIVDGAYLLKTGGAKAKSSRADDMATVYNGLKSLAITKNLPVFISSQFNRNVKSKSENADDSDLDVRNISLSDAAGWNTSLVYAMFQTEQMKRDNRMGLAQIKGREVPMPRPMQINWDFDYMDFSEIGGGGDADEHGVPDDDDVPF